MNCTNSAANRFLKLLQHYVKTTILNHLKVNCNITFIYIYTYIDRHILISMYTQALCSHNH